jgi:hypothetical protein
MTNNRIPDFGYVRLKQILGDRKTDPPTPPIIPVSRATWYQGIKDGRFPKPIKLGERISVWRVEDIRALVEATGE